MFQKLLCKLGHHVDSPWHKQIVRLVKNGVQIGVIIRYDRTCPVCHASERKVESL